MKYKYLIRAGYDPRDSYSFKDALYNNITGDNSGNQLYAYGVFNILSTPDNLLTSTFYRYDFSDEEIDYINNTYDAFVLPLADAFRVDWINVLEAYTKLIKKLTIPCVVIGACLRAPYGQDVNEKFPFDDAVKNFVYAVLDKSSIIGLRGWTTGNYLRKFGLKENRDYTAIGCPSLYTYGNTVVTKDIPTSINKIILNINPNVQESINHFIMKSSECFQSNVIVLQENDEFARSYFGRKYKNWPSQEFSVSRIYELSRKNGIKYFCNPSQWFNYVSQFDLSLGTRFHGTVANILSGIPHVIIPIDSRMKELVEFHNITHIYPNDIKNDIRDHFETLDFKSFMKGHKHNIDNYIAFLKQNNLNTVFDYKDINLERGKSYLESNNVCHSYDSLFVPYNSSSFLEKRRRDFTRFYSIINKNAYKKSYFSFKER